MQSEKPQANLAREIIVSRRNTGNSYREIAAEFGIDVSKVRAICLRANGNTWPPPGAQ